MPKFEEVPIGICECGCGNATKIWTGRTNIPARRFRGFPSPRISGHSDLRTARGSDRPSWKGGRHRKDGYIAIYAPDHPNVQPAYGTMILEHRYVMSQHLNRPLSDDEIVHHKNGDKADNRLENLELMTRSEHILHHNLEEGRIPPKRQKKS